MAALRRRTEQATSVSLLALEIDHFKQVNDRLVRLIEYSVRAGDG